MGRSLRANGCGVVRPVAARRSPPRPASRPRRLRRDAVGADAVRPGEAGVARRGHRVPAPLHSPRDGRARRARRGARAGIGARSRQPVRPRLRPRCAGRDLAWRLSQPPGVASAHGPRARRPDSGDQQDLHLAQPEPRRSRRAARHEGGAARAERVPPRRRQGPAADVLADAGRGGTPADRHRRPGRAGAGTRNIAFRARRRNPRCAARSSPVAGDPRGSRGARGTRKARRVGRRERRYGKRLPRPRSDDGPRVVDSAVRDARRVAASRPARGAAAGDAADGRRRRAGGPAEPRPAHPRRGHDAGRESGRPHRDGRDRAALRLRVRRSIDPRSPAASVRPPAGADRQGRAARPHVLLRSAAPGAHAARSPGRGRDRRNGERSLR